MKRILSLMSLALLLQGCAMFNSAKTTSVPFRLLNNHILMPVTVNGVEMEFIFDTSAENTALIKNKVNNLAVKNNDNEPHNLRMQIGNLTLSVISGDFITLKGNKGFSDTDGIYFDGIIGHDLLSKYIVEIDYDTQLISFKSRKAFNKDISQQQNNWESVPISLIQGQPFISMPLTLGDYSRYLDFALNTGSNLDFKLPKEALDDALTPAYSYTFTHFDLSGEHKYKVYPLDRIYLGDHPKIWPLIHTPVNDTDNLNNQFGMIGNAVLSRFNLIIDIEGKTLYFQENKRHSIKNFPDRSGLTITPHKSGAVVTSVASPASSLLRVNDIIQSYEGIKITKSTFDGFRLMLSSEAEELWVCWLREQERQCGNLTLAYRM